MKYIELTQGKRAIVDDEDYEWLNQWKWQYHASPSGKGGYARRTVRSKSLPKGYLIIMMHRLVNNTPDGFITDHRNRNKLDNRRRNLQTATASSNKFNTDLRADNTSGVKGVWWETGVGRWVASIALEGKRVTLGRFDDFEDAVNLRLNAECQLLDDLLA